jgi:hypothetical protein
MNRIGASGCALDAGKHNNAVPTARAAVYQ